MRRSILFSTVILGLMVMPAFSGEPKDSKAGKKATPDAPKVTVTRTYSVADVIPLRLNAAGLANPDLLAFAKMLVRSTGEDHWAINDDAPGGRVNVPEGATAIIIPFRLSVSLIIRGTEADHEAISNRIKLLREYKAMAIEPEAKEADSD